MKIPASEQDREFFFSDIINRCFASQESRRSTYDYLKNYYLWGNAQGALPVEYNKLFAHIDLLTSFLFSGETTSFVVEVEEDESEENGLEMEKAKKLTPGLNKKWHNSNLDIVFNEALTWALVFCSTILKLVPRQGGGLDAYVVDPYSFGVLLEHEPMLDKQPAMAHRYYITKSDFERKISALPKEKQDQLLGMANFQEIQLNAISSTAPTGTDKLIIAATTPNVQGNVVNPLTAQYDFDPKINEPSCEAVELWVWDDDACDYHMAVLLEGEHLFYDGPNNFLEREHPFIKITPNSLYNYFWGRTEMMYLIPIQEWINERIPEIKKHLRKQTSPPRTAVGFNGFTDEKSRSAFDTPGGWATEQAPNGAKVEQHFPALINVWEILDRAEMMFAEVSGIRELMQGKGESGVRARTHADLLVRVGSSRVKKKAAILEDAVEKIGYLMFKMMQRYDKTHYKTEKGLQFVAAQLKGNFTVKVDSHSSSPIFVEQQMDKATVLFKAGAIDREDLIDAVKPQNAGLLKKKLRMREKALAAKQLREEQNEKKEDEKVS